MLKVYSKSNGYNSGILRTEKMPFCPPFPSTPMEMNILFGLFMIPVNEIRATHLIRSEFGAVLAGCIEI